MAEVISVGNQSFKSIREMGAFYIDKTKFIKEWWESGDIVTLITRPRRFGKTLNLSMTECFFSKEYAGKSSLFEGLDIWNNTEYQNLQGKFPVLFISFAGIKADNYKTAREGIINIIIDLYAKYSFLFKSKEINIKEREYFGIVNSGMSDIEIAMSLNRLSLCMSRCYGKKVIILLDEYDTPLQEAYLYGYWDKMVLLVRSLFNYTFKTNPYLERGLVTGITRISKESVFSDLNNIVVITTTSHQYTECFGFTEEEVFNSLEKRGLSGWKEKVKNWYDGFAFGGKKDIYNPWSVTSFLKEQKLKTYWANTSSNSLAGQLVKEGTQRLKTAFEDLLDGKQVLVEIDEEIEFNQLGENDMAVWSLLLAAGYLKVDKEPENEEDDIYGLSFTNYEVMKMFHKIIKGWFSQKDAGYNDFVKSLVDGDIGYMNQFMNEVSERMFSTFDTGNKPSGKTHPERFYHGFVLGLIVDLAGQYHITSNRESGFGRYDVMLEPLNGQLPAIIMEFKVFNSAKEKSLQETVENALKQIKEKEYNTEFISRGISEERIHHYGFAFEGKKVLIGN
ncbi:MAG: AAA family ATPase [Lachnospiraceae bacterium]|nr:AAA family ATPase [Lachnospiraceae bacterium]